MPPSAKPISVQKIKRATLERDFLHTSLSILRHLLPHSMLQIESSPAGIGPVPATTCLSTFTTKLINNLILFPYINITACKTLVNLIKFIRYYLCKLICWIIFRGVRSNTPPQTNSQKGF